MAEFPDWIEQDEFEQRAARFGRSLFAEATRPSARDEPEAVPAPAVVNALPDGAPADATVVGQLAVWSPARPDAESAARSDPKRPPRQRDRSLVGRSSTGEALWFHSSLGRCNSVTLRFGDRGLYYNSSSHGTVTFVLNDYSPRPASDDEAPDNAGDVTRQIVIVEGCHAQGPVDHAGWVAARRFALRVFVACGRAGTRTPIEALHGRAWVELLQQLGVGTAAAQCLGLAFFPWLEGGAVHELNEAALWGWISAGYSTDLATWQDWQREVLERFLRDETR